MNNNNIISIVKDIVNPKIDKVAQAIAWSELTAKGQKECSWTNDFAVEEVLRYRRMAIAAIEAM